VNSICTDNPGTSVPPIFGGKKKMPRFVAGQRTSSCPRATKGEMCLLSSWKTGRFSFRSGFLKESMIMGCCSFMAKNLFLINFVSSHLPLFHIVQNTEEKVRNVFNFHRFIVSS
jgi:hypothetical protein